MPKKKIIKRKKKITENNVQIELFKAISGMSEVVAGIKEILSSLFEMEMKQSGDLGIMNERWTQMKELIEKMSGDIEEIKIRTSQLVTQWDYKEREKMISKRGKSINWRAMGTWLIKNPIPSILIGILIIGTLLTLTGVISWSDFLEGLGKFWPSGG